MELPEWVMLTQEESKYYKEVGSVVPLPYGLGEALSHLSRGLKTQADPETRRVPLTNVMTSGRPYGRGTTATRPRDQRNQRIPLLVVCPSGEDNP
jgi:hypothetical protein